MQLAKTGTPSGLIATSAFQGLAVSELGALGVAGLPLLVVEHPLGGERPEAIARRARQAVEQLASLIGHTETSATGENLRVGAPRTSLRPPTVVSDLASPVTVSDTPEALLAAFCEREWCDGLPIVPPTEERVRAMLGKAPPERSLGAMPPLWRQATLEKLAVNAVMAGCEPAYFPVVVAAVEAMLEPAFNLYGVQATTHPVAPLLIVHGPIARELGVHAGSGCFGPGFRANATIGRAIQIGRASCRERVEILVVAGVLRQTMKTDREKSS